MFYLLTNLPGKVSRALGSSTQTPRTLEAERLGASAGYSAGHVLRISGSGALRMLVASRWHDRTDRVVHPCNVQAHPHSMTMCSCNPSNVKRLRSASGLSYITHRVDLNPATRGMLRTTRRALVTRSSAEHTQTTPQDTSVQRSHTGPLKSDDTSHTCRVHRRYSSERYGHGRSCASPPLQLCHNGRRQVQLWRHVRPCRP